MNCYKLLKVIIPIVIIMTVIGCDFKLYNGPEVGEGAWREYFIATMNIDGSDVELLRSSAQQSSIEYARPYFVRDLAGSYEDEVILIDMGNKIDIMSLDGNYRRTIIDSLGGVQYFNQDRTKMLICHDAKVYLCSVDGSEVEKISLNYISHCFTPSLSFDEKSILYLYAVRNSNNELIEKGVMEYCIETGESIQLLISPVENNFHSDTYSEPARVNDESIVYTFASYSLDNNNVSSLVTYDYREHNLITGEVNTILESGVSIKYSHLLEYSFYNTNSILNLLTHESQYLQSSVNDVDDANFSSDDRYLMLNEIVYDIQADSTIFVEDGDFFGKYNHVRKTDMNLNNTKLVGIVDYLHY